MKNSRFYFVLLVNVLAMGGLFFWMNPPKVAAQWVLRDGTAVNPVAVCRDGAYIGVGVQFEGSASVTGRLLPGEEVLFSETFTPMTAVDNAVPPFLIRADYYFVPFDTAYTPLTVGDEVNFGYPMGIDVIGRVGDCYIETDETPTGVGFTYQGRLDDGGRAADGVYDLQFRIYSAESRGVEVGGIVTHNDVAVTDGLFTVELDFGDGVFTGSERWLAIGVRDGNSTGGYTVLTPRQEITAVPYALGLRAGAVISGSTIIDEGLLSLKNNTGEGLIIERAHNGVIVRSSTSAGVWVEATDSYGVYVNESGGDGVVVWEAAGEGVYVNQAGGDGLSVGEAAGDGVSVFSAGDDGVYVSGADNDGLYIRDAGNPSTFNFQNSQNDGIEIANAEDDGIYIHSADDDGIEIVSAGNVGILADGDTWAGFFLNSIFVSGNCTGCNIAVFGRNGSAEPLSVGDLVTVDGLAAAGDFANVEMIMNVRRATAGDSVVGVVADVAVVMTDERGEMLAPQSGSAAQAGEYVSIVIYGVAQVKASAAGGAMAAGERVTLAETNMVRALETTEVNGLQLAENAPTVGTALEAFDGDADGLIWVLINPQ